MNRFLTCIASIFFSLTCIGLASGQVDFKEQAFAIDGNDINSGSPMGVTDLNGDGLDDLLILDDANDLYVVYQTRGEYTMAPFFIQNVSNQRQWNIQSADLNQDGRSDILVGGTDGLFVLKAGADLGKFPLTTISADNFLTQGASLADMDGDGDLDLFVCDDDKENFIALNNGNGDFSPTENFMDFSTTPPSDGSGNYGSVFCDYDRDGDLDLYISKCRLGSVPGDPERTNQFFENTEAGFVRNNDYPNILSNDQSWVADFVDVDNDGDWDLFVANHGAAPMNLFIQQDDGTFVDEAEERGVDFFAGVIQLVAADFDNDGDVDVFAPGTDHIMFLNDGTGHFTDAGFPEGQNQIESATAGDFNHDGLLDIYAGYAQVYNSPSNIRDRIFINQSNENNFIKFSLEGQVTNSTAVGATVEIFIDGNSQLREIRAGESYGINRSNIVHFGLGTSSTVDSVSIYWPSGNVEQYFNLSADETYLIKENEGSITHITDAIQSNKRFLCGGDSMVLTSVVADEYLWSDGSTNQSLLVTEPGVYSLEVRQGSRWVTMPAFQVSLESFERPNVEVDGSVVKCMAESVELSKSTAIDYPLSWNNGLSGEDAIEVISAGTYFYAEERECGTIFSDSVLIENIAVAAPTTENDTVDLNSPATLFSNQVATNWTTDSISPEIIHVGQTFEIDMLLSDRVLFAATADTTELAAISVGLLEPIAADGYHNTQIAGGVLFTAHRNCQLSSVTVYARTAGVRQIVVEDLTTNTIIFDQPFSIEVGKNDLTLNLSLNANRDYEIRTDENVNLDNLGFPSPDFVRGVDRVEYPLENEFVEITESTFGTGQYYYFYDWIVQPEDKICYSYWQPALAIVDSMSSVRDEELLGDFNLYPNPSTGKVYFEIENFQDVILIEILDVTGQTIESRSELSFQNEIKLDLDGLYFLKIKLKNGRDISRKFLIRS